MKYLILALLLTGCASRHNSTLFLKEDTTRFYNLQNEECIVSGYTTYGDYERSIYHLTTFYTNCAVHTERYLKEFELKDWGIEKPKLIIGAE